MLNTFSILSLIIAIPFMGMLFVLTAREDENASTRNIYNVSLFAVIANIVMIWRIFMLIDVYKSGFQLIETFNWMDAPDINITFGVDVFSLLMILAIHIAFVIGFLGVRNNLVRQKSLMVLSLLFLSMVTGFFVAADIFSFYIFFEGMLLPLFMLMGMFGEIRRQGLIHRFLLYNMLGAVLFFVATVFLFNYQGGAVKLDSLRQIELNSTVEYFIWGAIFVSLLSRIPVWPFHYWISSINSHIKNPLIFIISSIIPLTGIYGFVRFLPKHLPDNLSVYVTILQIVCVVTMLFIALIGFINKDRQYKMFAYITIYYIMYLLGVLTRVDVVLLNIAFSFFSYLIIVSALEVIASYLYKQQESLDVSDDGILCAVPRISFVYSFLVLAGIGMPLSSLFLNNFLILSNLLAENIKMGMIVVCSLVLVSATLLQELFRLKDRSRLCPAAAAALDLDKAGLAFMVFVCFVLIMSFVKPLWFVLGV